MLIAIDPGCSESAFVVWNGSEILLKGKEPNEAMIQIVKDFGANYHNRCVIEQIASYGMAVGAEVFETVYWSGRFCQAFGPERVDRVKRLEVKMHLCHDSKAKDANIRAALIDRFGGPTAIKGPQKAKPKKGIPEAPAGALHGISKDVWSALAVGITYWDRHAGARGDDDD